MHGVRFIDLKGAKNACRGFRFDEDAKLLTIKGLSRRLPKLTTRIHAASDFAMFSDTSQSIASKDLQFSIEAEDGQLLGWCLMDEAEFSTGSVYGIQLMGKVERVQDSDGKRTKIYVESILLVHGGSESDEDGTYKRVGVGRISTPEPWFANCGVSNIRIT